MTPKGSTLGRNPSWRNSRRNPVGTRPRLAMDLILYSGSRGGDAYLFGPQHIRDGWLTYVPAKTYYLRADESAKPVLPALAATIAASKLGKVTFIETDNGSTFSKKGFQQAFSKWC